MSLNPLASWLADEPLPPAFVRGVLGVAHAKAQFRRFEQDFQHTAFSVERRNEIMDEERECERADARREELYGAGDE